MTRPGSARRGGAGLGRAWRGVGANGASLDTHPELG